MPITFATDGINTELDRRQGVILEVNQGGSGGEQTSPTKADQDMSSHSHALLSSLSQSLFFFWFLSSDPCFCFCFIFFLFFFLWPATPLRSSLRSGTSVSRSSSLNLTQSRMVFRELSSAITCATLVQIHGARLGAVCHNGQLDPRNDAWPPLRTLNGVQ